MQTAVSTNPALEAVSQNRKAVETELRQARGLYLPQVDITAGYGPEWTNDPVTRLPGNNDTVSFDRVDASAVLSQRLFDGFEAAAEVERQKARVISAARRVTDNSEVIGLDAVGAYLEVLRQRELVDLTEALVDFHLEIQDMIQERVDSGASGSSDLSQTNVRLNRSRAALSRQMNQLRDAEANYERVVGMMPGSLMRPDFPLQALPADLDGAVSLAASENPKIAILDADIEVAQAEVRKSDSAFYPKLFLEAETRYGDDIDAVRGWEWQSRIMVRLRWNLYRGGIDQATYREFLYRLNQKRAERVETYRQAVE
ncbi:MAG: TolC family protein, partial [Alphaproteobacteria bacterium]|nr:TolC family protein [Alphaproteobacteria bacterium]